MVVPVRDEALFRNDLADTLTGLLSPFSAWELMGLVHIYIIMPADQFYLGTRPRPVLFYAFWYLSCTHVAASFISVISLKIEYHIEAEITSKKCLKRLFFNEHSHFRSD